MFKLFPLCMHVIMPSFLGSEKCITSFELLIARVIKVPNSYQKKLKNSHVKPSGPGLLSFFIF